MNTDLNNNSNIGIFDPDGLNSNPLNQESYSNNYKNLAKFWSGLPAYKMAKNIVELIIQNDIILIKSGTGSGKTVLIPKLALHANNYKGRIIITLPKKIITKKAAEFAAKTLDVELGEEVGYQFKGDNLKSKKTILLYSTDGSLISQIKSDPMLKSIDIIIIDEAHERKVQIDLLLYLLKNAIKLRKEKKMNPLKLIIMSATINENLFEVYYKDFSFKWIELAGTPNFPIKSIYLESKLDLKYNQYLEKGSEIIENIVKNINSNNKNFIEGDILFFVCTVSECNKLTEKLESILSDCFIMGLYSNFDPELEQYINSNIKFKELNPNYKRRIFISTNVAESSLTIDGIVYVIDSGLELSVKFNPIKNTNNMGKNFITQAQMTQRKGRAGRTKPGVCYHLYTLKQQEECLKFPEPEIKCIDIKNTCLTMIKLGMDLNPDTNFGVKEAIHLFTHFIEPPGEQFILNGFNFAIEHELIGSDSLLSNIGKLIVASKFDVQDGLSLLYAWNQSNLVFEAVLKIIIICSFLKSGINDLFYSDVNNSIKNNILKKLIKDSNKSEHVLLYNLYNYIESNKDNGIFEIKKFNSIQSTYQNQINKIEKIYKKFDIKIDNIKKFDFNKNIINSFGYGYRFNRAFRSNNGYKYNGINVDLSKCNIKFDKSNSSIIFYLNLNWSNKLSLMICSPYLLN